MLPEPTYLGKTLFGKFRLEEVFNRTELGYVYRGTHLGIGRPIRLTLVDISGPVSADQRARFERQGAAASQLTHPGVVRIYDVGRHDAGFLYCVEEDIVGQSLFALTEAPEPLDRRRLARLMVRATEILGEAHRQELYHLRLTPSDIIFADGRLDPDAMRIRHFAGVPWGEYPAEPRFAAPEQFTSETVGPAADVYILGLVLWQVMVGAAVMGADSSRCREFHLSEQRPSIAPNTGFPRGLATIIERALCRHPEDRFATMDELGIALKQWSLQQRASQPEREQHSGQQSQNQQNKGQAGGSDSSARLAASADPLSNPTPFPLPGEVFADGYKVESMIGSGGFARVYAARRMSDQRRIAIKVLWRNAATQYDRDQRGGESAVDIARRFAREAQVVSLLESPHTISLLDFGETDDGLLFHIYEYIDGQDLSAWLPRQGPVDAARVVPMVRQVLASLAEAHDRGILHRDIKPANLMFVAGEGPARLKVVDFGIAKALSGVLDETRTDLTAAGQAVGTPRYMAPEQLRGEPVGPPSDLYSLGLVIYEMLTGEPAVSGENTYQIVAKQLADDELRLPEELEIAPTTRHIVDRLLRKPPIDRFQSADEVLRALMG